MSVKLVGILNVTPDSFADGGRYVDPEAAIAHADAMIAEGADLVDVGAESTRPGATPIPPEEERRRLEPVLPRLLAKYPGQISLDTRHPEIARWAAERGWGDFVLNDVTTFCKPGMIAVAAEFGLRCIASHLPLCVQGDVQRAHKDFAIDSIAQVRDELLAQKEAMVAGGIKNDHIILDPGIGFGKENPQTNRKLLWFAREVPEETVLIGYSQKRFLGVERHNLRINVWAGKTAIKAGAAYIRVHDVKGHEWLRRLQPQT